MANPELTFPKLSDVDQALQIEKYQGVDRVVEEEVRKKVKLASKYNLHTETLPEDDGGARVLISS